ncbi:MAG: hypothetical protein CME70_20520 [Halobacteriovorax sp.]|nr:hypothetical protein [Halobacteriovorax sp.]
MLKEHMERFKDLIIRYCMGYPKSALGLGLLITFIFLPYSTNIVLDFSARTWFRANDPNITQLDSFEKKFGNDESAVLVMHSKNGFFDRESLKTLHKVTEAIWQVPDIARVDSLNNQNLTTSIDDDISTEEFIPVERIDDEGFLEERKKAFQKHKVLPGVFLTKDYKSAVIYGRVVQKPEGEVDFDAIFDGFQKVGRDLLEPSGIEYHILGAPSLNVTFKRTSFKDLRTINPILVGLVIIYLIFCFRNFWGVFLPLTVIGTTLIFMTGLIGFLQIKMNSLTFILPGIIIAIAIADSVHLLSTYFDKYAEGEELNASLKAALDKNISPIFLTSISTAIGFFSLTTSDVRPVAEMGLLAGIATIMAFVLSLLYIPSTLILFNVGSTKAQRGGRAIKKLTARRYIKFLERWHKSILVSFILISGSFTWLALQNEVNSNPYEYFNETNPISIGNQFTLKTFKGVGGPELVIDSGRENGITDPGFLKIVDQFQTWLNERDYINRIISITDIIKEVNQSLHGGQEDMYRIPDSKEMIAQEIFLYTMGLPQGMDLNNRIDLKQRELRLSVLWNVQNSKESLIRIEEIETKAEELGLKMASTGKPVLFQRMNGYVVETFTTSMGMALVLITLILIVVYRSFKMGLLSLIPNFIPIVLGAGLLTIIKTPVDVGCAIVASVTLGIAVDDTIHFLSHYSKLIREGSPRVEALTEVISGTGVALIVTTMILVSGFGLFMFASLTPNKNFGILSSFVLFMALFCDLVILPCIVLAVESLSGKKIQGVKIS